MNLKNTRPIYFFVNLEASTINLTENYGAIKIPYARLTVTMIQEQHVTNYPKTSTTKKDRILVCITF